MSPSLVDASSSGVPVEPAPPIAVKPLKTLRAVAPKPKAKFRKTVTMWLRRGHLYLGLFLFPWAILYGVTAFLFNHPTVASDVPMLSYGPEAYAGTALASLPSPAVQAQELVDKLNERDKPETPYKIAGDARYSGRELAFAIGKVEGQNQNISFDLVNGGGTLRSTPEPVKVERQRAPFEKLAESPTRGGPGGPGGGGPGGGGRGGRGGRGGPGGPGGTEGALTANVKLANPIQQSIEAAIPTVLERSGFPVGTVTVTSVPDIAVPIEAAGQIWNATYQPMTGAISATPAGDTPRTEISIRRFLLRLHMAHGYPSSTSAKWFWAVVVDLMAFTMCFWGMTGLIMWWAIKSTRVRGIIAITTGLFTAAVLGVLMYQAMTMP